MSRVYGPYMSNRTASPRIIGTKPGQYQGRTVELVTADGDRLDREFPNAASQGAAVRKLAAAGVVVVAFDYTNNRIAAMYAAAAAKRAANA